MDSRRGIVMALPLPKVVADVEAGGPLATSMRGLNALTQSNVEAKYAPLTVPAKAMSELAYSSFVQPQYLAKLMGNENFVANMTPQQREQAKNMIYGAGTGQVSGNSMLNIPSIMDQINQSPLQKAVNAVKGAFGFGQSSSGSTPVNAMLQNQPAQQPIAATGGAQGNADSSSYDKNGNNVKGTPQDVDAAVTRSTPQQAGTTTNTSAPNPDQYAENAAHYRGIIKAGEELGTARGKTIADLGEQQLTLSNSGVSLDRLTKIIQNPEFQNMRNQIPFFQDKQLGVLSKIGNKSQQDLIGDFISTAQAFKISTINSFKGKTLEKEFNLADKIKIDENDTMGVAQGKLRALTTLKDIAQAKNDMIIDLMTNKNMNQGDAVRITNKLVKTNDIEKQVNNILNPPVTIMYKNNQKYHIPNEKVDAAKKAGYSNGR